MKVETRLTEVTKSLITNYNAGVVASINEDGSPAASPKATFVIIDDSCIAYGDIRSPGTAANIARNPNVEIVFTDILTRRAVRICGVASIVDKSSEQGINMMPLFEQNWGPYIDHMSVFVKIDITQAELILSPAYDLGISKEVLVKTNLEKLQRIANV